MNDKRALIEPVSWCSAMIGLARACLPVTIILFVTEGEFVRFSGGNMVLANKFALVDSVNVHGQALKLIGSRGCF